MEFGKRARPLYRGKKKKTFSMKTPYKCKMPQVLRGCTFEGFVVDRTMWELRFSRPDRKWMSGLRPKSEERWPEKGFFGLAGQIRKNGTKIGSKGAQKYPTSRLDGFSYFLGHFFPICPVRQKNPFSCPISGGGRYRFSPRSAESHM